MAMHTGESLDELDELLGPVWARGYVSPAAQLLAVLVCGIANRAKPEAIRLWVSRANGGAHRAGVEDVRSQHGIDEEPAVTHSGAAVMKSSPSTAELISNGRLWSSFRKAAERKVLSSPSVTGDVRGARLGIARRLYGGLLMPLPHSEGRLFKRDLSLRVAMTHLNLRMLSGEEGWDSVYFTQPLLAAVTGWSPRTAWEALKVLEEIGAVNRLSKAKTNGRFRVPELSGKRLDALAGYEQGIVAIVDGVPDPLADVILSLSHPAWNYSETLSHGHWLTLVADVAGISVKDYRMRPQMEKGIRAALNAEYLIPATVHPYLVEILDHIADDPEHGKVDPRTGQRISARVAAQRVMQAYEASAKERTKNVNQHSTAKKDAYAALEIMLQSAPIPEPPHKGRRSTQEQRAEQLVEWREQMREVTQAAAPRDFETAGREALGKMMIRRGYGPGYTESALDYIIGPVESVARLEPLEGDRVLSGAQLSA